MQALFSWFDLVTIVMLALGIWVGRRRGMSGQVLDLILWLVIVTAGSWLNPSMGGWIRDVMGLSPGASHILAYLVVIGGVLFFGFLIRRWVGQKLMSSDTFGNLEYYLGMVAGAVQFMCILLAVLAVLNAPKISQEELDRKLASQRNDLGEIYFPPFGQIQQSIFQRSLTGRTVKRYLSAALVQKSSAAGQPSDNIYRSRERLVDEAGGLR